MLEQAPTRTCGPTERGAHARAGLLAGLVTPWGPTLEQPVPEGLHPVGGTHAGAVREELQPVGRTHIEAVCGELSPVRGPQAGAGAECEESSPEGQGAAETTCAELTVTSSPHPPVPLGGRRERNRSEAEPSKKGGVGGRCLKIWIYFSLSYSDLTGDE